MMELEIIESKYKNPMLAMGGYLYHCHSNLFNKKLWLCSERKKKRCPVLIHTTDCSINPQLLLEKGSHSHEPDPAKIDVKRMIAKVKKDAANSQEAAKLIIQRNIQGMPSASEANMPLLQNINRIIRKVRGVEEAPLANPTRRENIDLPTLYTQTNGKEDFILFDSGPSVDRIMIFGTQANLDFLSTCFTWLFDGTFKSSPSLFDQLFVIHGLREGVNVPLLYCLTPDRFVETYDRIFAAIRRLNPNLQPTTLMSDLELASWDAFSSHFPNVERKVCLFHLRQRMFSQIQASPDVFQAYSNNADFKLMLCHLVALAFVPPEYVVTAYEALLETDFFVTHEEMLNDYLRDYEQMWIGTMNPRRTMRFSPRISIQSWNCFHLASDDLPRTSNSFEGFHNGFNQILSGSHPTIYKLINSMKVQQSLTEIKIQQLYNQTPSTPNKVYMGLGQKIKRSVENYSQQNIVEYLRCICLLINKFDSLPTSDEQRVLDEFRKSKFVSPEVL